jgi:hypothetical protein
MEKNIKGKKALEKNEKNFPAGFEQCLLCVGRFS